MSKKHDKTHSKIINKHLEPETYYTPGPWRAVLVKTGIYYDDTGTWVIDAEPNGPKYPTVRVATILDHQKQPIAANATLIAAGPEMLDALEEAKAALEGMTDGSCLVSVLNAIKKARGGV